MAKRLEEAEKALQDIRSDELGSQSSPADIGCEDEPGEKEPSPPMLEGDPVEDAMLAPSSINVDPTGDVREDLAPTSPAIVAPAALQRCNSTVGQVQSWTKDNHATSRGPAVNELSVDEHGKIAYYGPTSAVHDPPASAATSMPTVSTLGTDHSSRAEMQSVLAAYARESATWGEFAVGNASLETGIPRHLMTKLLHVYWAWVSPMFMWVYKPAFVRDMATGGRYYSDFLLTVICAHAAKYQDSNAVDILLARARRLLGTAIQQPSSIPTIQALLQLSARDLAQGSISQAWVYSGIAFRMASDLGLQQTGPGIKGIGPLDLEIRRRLYWSCYFWDKATSLYAGRLPAVTELLDPSTLDMLDESSEVEDWTPYFEDSLNLTKLSHFQYPKMRSYSVSCFANSCKLSIIINDVIEQLYSRKSRTITEEALRDLQIRLDTWRDNSPSYLRYNPANLPVICPPPHIISQNLLYFTTVILAHRPFWSVQENYQVCIQAAQGIERFILLLESTFGLGNITYMMGYCIYTGASAILEDAKRGEGAAFDTLKTYLRALNAGMKNSPLLERSLHIIVKGLNRNQPVSQTAPSVSGRSGDPDINIPGAFSYIPAFPYVETEGLMDFDTENMFSARQDMDSFGMLDSFPELHAGFGDLGCTI